MYVLFSIEEHIYFNFLIFKVELDSEQQELVNWINIKFEEFGVPTRVLNLSHDLRDGLKLIELAQLFTGQKVHGHFLTPMSLIECSMNVAHAIRLGIWRD